MTLAERGHETLKTCRSLLKILAPEETKKRRPPVRTEKYQGPDTAFSQWNRRTTQGQATHRTQLKRRLLNERAMISGDAGWKRIGR